MTNEAATGAPLLYQVEPFELLSKEYLYARMATLSKRYAQNGVSVKILESIGPIQK